MRIDIGLHITRLSVLSGLAAIIGNLLREDGAMLLLESGSFLLLE